MTDYTLSVLNSESPKTKMLPTLKYHDTYGKFYADLILQALTNGTELLSGPGKGLGW